MASVILVVDDDPRALSGMAQLLENAGYRVRCAGSVPEAKWLLENEHVDLLITDVRLGAFNGLQLAVQTQVDYPRIPVIAITGFTDPVIEAEARRLGAEFLQKPVKFADLLELIARRLSDTSRQRRWPRKLVPGGFAGTIGYKKVRLVDMSYGGFRFEMPDVAPADLPDRLEVTLPQLGLSVKARTVWLDQGESGTVLGGAALSEVDRVDARTWRGVVDSLASAAL
jgi:DNA-binding response OmpR family regulator